MIIKIVKSKKKILKDLVDITDTLSKIELDILFNLPLLNFASKETVCKSVIEKRNLLYFNTRTLDVHVSNIRRKINKDIIITKNRVGIKLNPKIVFIIID